MYNLTHRSCSNCIYWADFKYEDNGLMKACCEQSLPYKERSGGDKCGQWKKIQVEEKINV